MATLTIQPAPYRAGDAILVEDESAGVMVRAIVDRIERLPRPMPFGVIWLVLAHTSEDRPVIGACDDDGRNYTKRTRLQAAPAEAA